MYRKYSTRGRVERLIQHKVKLIAVFAETPPKCCIFHTHKHGQWFKCYIVLPGHLALSITQTAVIFSDQDISKCLYNLFVVVESTNRNSLASFSDVQCHAWDQSCCLMELCLNSFVIRRSISIYAIYF